MALVSKNPGQLRFSGSWTWFMSCPLQSNSPAVRSAAAALRADAVPHGVKAACQAQSAMEAMARLSRAVIDEVLLHTQEDILIGHDEHVARGIVRDLQQRWERKLSEAQAQRLSDQALLSQTAPGQVIDPDYQTRSSSSSAAANVHHGQAGGNTEDNATADGKAEANGNGKEEAAESSGIRALKKRPASKSPPRKVKKTRTDETSEDASLGTSDDDEAEVTHRRPLGDSLSDQRASGLGCDRRSKH